ncbi:hypothetical protein TWF225_008844 [Orbilia oligospora]|uniref:Uncharacterized protein n=1 Tax=Orbilia oligospora TaxID=2813651 RepID=A0A8H2DV05_ORBOL|nr:hypothetical protein TWF225_008844 [Orbilia oligospora]KAF3239137.1 hypothetical protein TWF128_011846 [Orbilia oligospora]KAF3284389.1 hypothetical protein TWF132_009818 [Orbilia oligospora]TGJ65333.1 hypothetical protein EYR41_009309 [Orbilia oligospora]
MVRTFTQSRSRQLYLLLILLVFVFYSLPSSPTAKLKAVDLSPKRAYPPRDIVVAALKHDDVSWIDKFLAEWQPRVYITDAALYFDKTSLTVPRNKGREANVYLTYIIDNYDKLPDYMVFIHSLRYQWHNEDPMYDGVPVLRKLRLSYVDKAGFVPLRCTWTLGCPSELKPTNPFATRIDDRSHTEEAYAEAFRQLFPNMKIPDVVGATCGGQFALAKWKILERPLEDYVRYRQWLMDTPLPDAISGRIFEYSWHIMFGKSYVNCPSAKECFCNAFGLCDLECNSEGECEKRYILPQYAVMPPGWPQYGPGTDGWPEVGWADGKKKKK